MKSTILDGPRTYTIYVRAEQVPEVEETKQTRHGAFVYEFWRKGAELKVTMPPIQWEDYGIAKRLLGKYGREHLRQLMWHFWMRYADDLNEGKCSHPMRLFEHQIPTIIAEITS